MLDGGDGADGVDGGDGPVTSTSFVTPLNCEVVTGSVP